MTESKESEAIRNISDRLAKLSEKRASGWEKTKTIGAVLTPMAVVIIGYFIQSGLATQQHALSEQIEEAKTARERELNKVNQAQLISQLLGPLLSEDVRERMLAVNIVLHACGEAGRVIVSSVAVSDPDEEVRRHAEESINQRRQMLVEQLGASHREVRQDAVDELATTWRNDPQLAKEMVQYFNEHGDDETIIHNLTSVMTSLPRHRLRASRQELLPFLDRAEQVGPKTNDRAQMIRKELR